MMTFITNGRKLLVLFGRQSILRSLAGIYLFKVNNGSIRTIYEICSKLTIKTPERRGVIEFVLVSLSLILNRFHTLLWCFHCWFGTSKCRLGCVRFMLIINVSKHDPQSRFYVLPVKAPRLFQGPYYQAS